VSYLELSFELDMAKSKKIKELDIARKKKQALDELSASKKISKLNYEDWDKKLKKELTDLEAEVKSLNEKITAKNRELEEQKILLESFFIVFELGHAVGDIDNEIYEKQNKSILSSLDAIKQELKILS